MLALTAAGACLGMLYGAAHDQITYTLGPEYFTRLKFHQFAWADIGLPPRAFAAEIGLLAVGWIGACAGWLLARVAVPAWETRAAARHVLIGLGIMLIFALAGGLAGHGLGCMLGVDSDLSNWEPFLETLGIQNDVRFVHVAYIHDAGYLGGLLGIATALAWLLRKRAARQGRLPKS